MRCHEAEGLLTPQFADCLDSATQHELGLHLESCAACRAKLQQEYEFDRLLIAAVNREVPPVDQLLDRVGKALDDKRSWRLIFAPRQWRWPALAGTAAVVLLCAFALTRFTAGDPMHLLCQDAVEDHTSEVVMHEPRHWHTTANEISDLARRTVSLPQVPRTLAGLSLQKARVCGLLQAPALHLVYGNGLQQFSVFLMRRQDLPSNSLPSEATLAARLHQESDAGVLVTSFADNGLGVVVVGNSNTTRNIANELVRSL